MFGIGAQELVLIGLLIVVIFGPMKAAGMARKLGHFVKEANHTVEDFKEELLSEEEDKVARRTVEGFKEELDLRRFRGLFETGNSARKGEQCHERTRPTLRSFAEKLSGWLELPMRSTLSPRSPARSVSPMAPFGAGSTKTRSTAASEKGSRQRRRKSSADSDAR